MITRIKQSQEELLLLCNDTNSSNVDMLETDAENIAKRTFPDGSWPNDLEPWPSLCIRHASILRACGRLEDALKQGVRGYLSLERRKGDIWIRQLFDFVQILANIFVLLKKDAPYGRRGFPTETQTWDIYYGYIHVLALGAKMAFGANTEYARAIQAWYANCRADGTSETVTPASGKRFDKAQRKLLQWAGVDEVKGITLH
jgi:hypothetical protein